MRLRTYVSTIKRDKSPKGAGWSPTFQIRITPELKAQFEAAAANSDMSLGNWLKTLGREELKRLGIEPKG
nr:toxin-antitoxin system HicB family antitoxin [Dickeya chrysanthemi]